MVFDVVASRQRRYSARVQPLIVTFEATGAGASLEVMAGWADAPVAGSRAGEWDTMRAVAGGLVRFGADNGLVDNDERARQWATAAGRCATPPSSTPTSAV